MGDRFSSYCSLCFSLLNMYVLTDAKSEDFAQSDHKLCHTCLFSLWPPHILSCLLTILCNIVAKRIDIDAIQVHLELILSLINY
jgi:hypothetical protein